MSHPKHPLLAVYVDGETKTGKGSASAAVAEALRADGRKVYYDVAGDFYRRYVAMVRRHLGLQETDDLPTGDVLQQAAQAVYDSGHVFDRDLSLGDLQRPSISKSVSVLGELELAYIASTEWYAASVRQALADGADVLVLDGRNPRSRVAETLDAATPLQTVLELYLMCDPAEAGRRMLFAAGTEPTAQELDAKRLEVEKRRALDRRRVHNPFVVPDITVAFDPPTMAAAEAVRQSWVPREDAPVPMPIMFDNGAVAKAGMIAAVLELATAAVQFALDRQAEPAKSM